MTSISQSEFLQALGWAVLNSLWQMALLWVVYQSVTALFDIKSSSQRSSLATFLLFAGFAWFVFSFVMILADDPQSSGYAAFINMDRNAALKSWLETSLPIASLIYLVLLTLPVLNFIRNYRYVQMIRRYGLLKANVEWRMFVQQMSARMGIHKPVQVWMSEMVSSPVTVGYLKPIILLPVAAINHLSADQVEAVLLHELSHIKRFDYFINLMSRLIQTVLYFNPFVKAFSRIIETEREKSCDELVMQFEYEPHGYASALLTLEKEANMPAQTLAVAASGVKKNELLGRIESILGIQKKQGFSFNKLAGIMAALLCFIGLNALLIISRPGISNAHNSGFLSQVSTPFLFLTDNNIPVAGMAVASNTTPEEKQIINTVEEKKNIGNELTEDDSINEEAASDEDHEPSNENHPVLPYTFVSNTAPVIPVLDAQQEAEVKSALDNSKKVIESIQWKVVEQNIGDALSQAEKVQVKKAYDKAMNKADWDQLADKMRVAYDQIDWKSVNSELNNAVAEIRLDSLQQVYNGALVQFTELKKELNEQGLKGVPDSDVTLKEVETKIREIEKLNNRIKIARSKAIIKL